MVSGRTAKSLSEWVSRGDIVSWRLAHGRVHNKGEFQVYRNPELPWHDCKFPKDHEPYAPGDFWVCDCGREYVFLSQYDQNDKLLGYGFNEVGYFTKPKGFTRA